jgi:HAD superfamily hydrolase (TIGR01509 family)
LFAVGFSLEGTLVKAPGLERLAFERLCAETVASSDAALDIEAVERAFGENRDGLTNGGEALNECIVQAMRAATGVEGTARALAARYRQIAGQIAAEIVEPLPGAERTLRELQALSVPLAILANGLSSSERRKAQAVGFAGELVVSEDTGVKKPDPRAFAALVEALGFPAECIWYLGSDFELDIKPALAAGLNVVWLAQEQRDTISELEHTPHVIHQTDELLELIKEPYTRSMLGLRYIMHDALAWRPGHFVPGEEYGLGR